MKNTLALKDEQLPAVIESNPQELMRHITDVAGVSKEIVLRTAMSIQGRKYVKVEGWQAIATAHGCMLSSCEVERIEGGVRAMGEVRRMQDGALLAKAEGFVGEDEATWFGGESVSYGKTKILPKRPDYAIRAMAQTRAMSRAARSAFAHVVVLIDAGLSTTPAEEVPMGGFDDDQITAKENKREETARTVNASSEPAAESDSHLQMYAWMEEGNIPRGEFTMFLRGQALLSPVKQLAQLSNEEVDALLADWSKIEGKFIGWKKLQTKGKQ